MVAINHGTAPATASFDAPAAWGDRPVRDVWRGEAVSSKDERDNKDSKDMTT
ncbi:MAG TPA: hypothetical protein VFC23_10935 [Thermoanaerobaculia bacterium]|nr:hypothetical protein [Thermoanaerobaculia bacterium]